MGWIMDEKYAYWHKKSNTHKKSDKKKYHIHKKMFGKFPMHTNVVKGLRNHAGKKWIPPTDSATETSWII